MFQFHYDTRSSSVAPVCVHLGTSGLKNNLTSFRNKCAACSVLFLYGHGKRNRDVCGVRDGIAAGAGLFLKVYERYVKHFAKVHGALHTASCVNLYGNADGDRLDLAFRKGNVCADALSTNGRPNAWLRRCVSTSSSIGSGSIT